MSEHTMVFLRTAQEIAARLEQSCLDRMAELLAGVRDNRGRVFFLGTGGSAANASHAVNDFRKIAEVECGVICAIDWDGGIQRTFRQLAGSLHAEECLRSCDGI